MQTINSTTFYFLDQKQMIQDISSESNIEAVWEEIIEKNTIIENNANIENIIYNNNKNNNVPKTSKGMHFILIIYIYIIIIIIIIIILLIYVYKIVF